MATEAEQILEVIEGEIGPAEPSRRLDELAVDSLDFLSLCQELERQFNVTLDEDDLTQVETVEELISLVHDLQTQN